MKLSRFIPFLLVLLGAEGSFAEGQSPPQLMQFVCRAYVPGAHGDQIDPDFAITVEQTATVEVEGKTYDGRYLVPGNDEFDDIYDLLGVGIPLRIRIYWAASSINRLGLQGKDFFDALESSGLPHERYDVQNPNMTIRPWQFTPLWTNDEESRCFLAYYHEERHKNLTRMLCIKIDGRIDTSSDLGLKCDPPYLVGAPKQSE